VIWTFRCARHHTVRSSQQRRVTCAKPPSQRPSQHRPSYSDDPKGDRPKSKNDTGAGWTIVGLIRWNDFREAVLLCIWCLVGFVEFLWTHVMIDLLWYERWRRSICGAGLFRCMIIEMSNSCYSCSINRFVGDFPCRRRGELVSGTILLSIYLPN